MQHTFGVWDMHVSSCVYFLLWRCEKKTVLRVKFCLKCSTGTLPPVSTLSISSVWSSKIYESGHNLWLLHIIIVPTGPKKNLTAIMGVESHLFSFFFCFLTTDQTQFNVTLLLQPLLYYFKLYKSC